MDQNVSRPSPAARPKRKKNSKYNVLCLGCDIEFFFNIKNMLEGYDFVSVNGLFYVEKAMQWRPSDVIVVRMPSFVADHWFDGVYEISQKFPNVGIIAILEKNDKELIKAAVSAGAKYWICRPFAKSDLHALIEKCRIEQTYGFNLDGINCGLPHMGINVFSRSPVIQRLFERARKLKGRKCNVMIYGETGTGKELLARYIHAIECDPRRPFVAINCAAIPQGLAESELFGHERGAFTGAIRSRAGKFEIASQGDIFLDDVSCLPLDLQAKLLRVLQEKEISRLGSNRVTKSDFRVIAATNEDLKQLVAEGKFRKDLYYRLNGVEFKIPPLRERPEDIAPLAVYFFSHMTRVDQKRFSSEVIRKLEEYPWFGNVRELENVVKTIGIMSDFEIVTLEDLPPEIRYYNPEAHNVLAESPLYSFGYVKIPNEINRDTYVAFIMEAERMFCRRAFEVYNNDRDKVAEVLGIAKSTLYDRLMKLGLRVGKFDVMKRALHKRFGSGCRGRSRGGDTAVAASSVLNGAENGAGNVGADTRGDVGSGADARPNAGVGSDGVNVRSDGVKEAKSDEETNVKSDGVKEVEVKNIGTDGVKLMEGQAGNLTSWKDSDVARCMRQDDQTGGGEREIEQKGEMGYQAVSHIDAVNRNIPDETGHDVTEEVGETSEEEEVPEWVNSWGSSDEAHEVDESNMSDRVFNNSSLGGTDRESDAATGKRVSVFDVLGEGGTLNILIDNDGNVGEANAGCDTNKCDTNIGASGPVGKIS